MPIIVSGSHQPSKTQHVDLEWTGGGWGPFFLPWQAYSTRWERMELSFLAC